jgi:hypothetical protein
VVIAQSYDISPAPSAYGSCYFATDNATAVTVTVANTYYKIPGTTTQGNCSLFTMSSNNRLQYTGSVSSTFIINSTISQTSNTTGTVYTAIAINGTVDLNTRVRCDCATINIYRHNSCSDVVTLNNNDYVELWVTHAVAGSTITVPTLYLTAEVVNGAGTSGTSSSSGSSGSSGTTGSSGSSGTSFYGVTSGTSGSSGFGTSGSSGVSGSSGSSGSSGVDSIFQAMSSLTTSLNSGTPVAIGFDSEDVKDANYTHSNVTNNSRIYAAAAGWYKVTYNINTIAGNGFRDTRVRIRVDGTTYLTKGTSYAMSRNNADAEANNNASVMISLTAGQYIELMGDAVGTNTAVTMIANESSITIERVR